VVDARALLLEDLALCNHAFLRRRGVITEEVAAESGVRGGERSGADSGGEDSATRCHSIEERVA
jgi:hypothetical protein